MVQREGPALSDLTADQQKAVDAVLQVALSGDGYQQDGDIRKADDYLNSLGGQGADDFGSLKDYHIAVYGQPSATQPFMIQFGVHHLARNLTYNGDKVSQTSQFVGSEPASFRVNAANPLERVPAALVAHPFIAAATLACVAVATWAVPGLRSPSPGT